MTYTEIEHWASAWIAYQQNREHASDHHILWWAVEKFMVTMDESANAEDCWLTVLAILSRNPSNSIIAMLAAGPLEDLIHFAGPRFIDRIELEACCNPAFQYLLGGVWRSSSPEIWKRIEAVRSEIW